MKALVATFLLFLATPADACGVAVFGTSSAEPVVVEPPPPASNPMETATMLIGGLLVASILARWVVAHRRSVFA